MFQKLVVLISVVATAFGQPVSLQHQKLLTSDFAEDFTGGAGDFYSECDSETDQCDTGYVCVNGNCDDVDECMAGTDNCGTRYTCSNMDGGFTCIARRQLSGNRLRNFIVVIIINLTICAVCFYCACQTAPENRSGKAPSDKVLKAPSGETVMTRTNSEVATLYF